MKRLLMLASLALAVMPVTACSPMLSDPASAGAAGAMIDATGAKPSASLAGTLIDEKGILMALQSADLIATGVDQLVANGIVVPGSPTALTIKRGLIAVRSALAAASAAQRAGNATSYAVAMSEASKAFREVATALNST